MDKYKDFKELEDTSDEGYKNLFLKRTYKKHLDNPLADDIIISDASVNGKIIYSNPERKISTYEERMNLRRMDASAAYTFSETDEIESAEFELSYFRLSEIEDRYLRKRVEAYRNVCREIIKKAENKEEEEKNKVSWRRVYSFILSEAFKRGEKSINNMSKNAFLRYVTTEMEFNSSAPYPIYQTVRSTYKGELNYLLYLEDMKKRYPTEYAQAMKLFRNYYPKL